jgi:hypothetical protein
MKGSNNTDAFGPLDPDPFVLYPTKVLSPLRSTTITRDDIRHLARRARRDAAYLEEVLEVGLLDRQPNFFTWGHWYETPGTPVTSTLATIAFIPKRALQPPYSWSFGIDRILRQPRWLSRACLLSKFRLLHAVRVDLRVESDNRFAPHPPRISVLGKSNHTTLFPWLPGVLPKIEFNAPIEESSEPAARSMPPPGLRRLGQSDRLFGLSSNMRSINGALVTPPGRLLSRLVALHLKMQRQDTSRSAPQIGSTIQMWATTDKCKCFAFAHNWFPQHDFYVDGVRLGAATKRRFDLFDGYGVDVEWQPYVALLLRDSLIDYPLRERYPGRAAVGWYKDVAEDGEIEWCDDGKVGPPLIIQFPSKPDDATTVGWWRELERYIEGVLIAFREAERSRNEEWWSGIVRRVAGLWNEARLMQADWRVLRLTDYPRLFRSR